MKTTNGIILDGNKLSVHEISNAGFHNSIYREKDIGSYLADGSIWERIWSGTFDDLFIGDYFEVDISGRQIMRIAGFDTFRTTYNRENGIIDHHAIIVPDYCLAINSMSESGITNGYAGTYAFQYILPSFAAMLEENIGSDHVWSVYEYLTSSVDNNAKNCLRPDLTGASNTCTWTAAKANLLSETEVFGYMSCSSSGYENGMGCYGQLPLFRLNPSRISVRDTNINGYWLRNIACSDCVCVVDSQGAAMYENFSVSESIGFRPRFIIG